ncbi:hypothetical protein LTR62_000675 [Meristemomyces frigidus]|uniref:Uncharacterized protein n=1 Tax=Meristemomyces frigidus TaxID=1508187 RepID=A0AAN7TA02_9PEZI|nr:hypothetical protein LTR62_000675 [Meristemomyces frigidus]
MSLKEQAREARVNKLVSTAAALNASRTYATVKRESDKARGYYRWGNHWALETTADLRVLAVRNQIAIVKVDAEHDMAIKKKEMEEAGAKYKKLLAAFKREVVLREARKWRVQRWLRFVMVETDRCLMRLFEGRPEDYRVVSK